jgi:pyruvate formate-lyase activating enzyme-like uncharacterized protein
MVIDITRDTLPQIKNPRFAAYAAMYARIYDDFMAQVRRTGIAIDAQDYDREGAERRQRLKDKGATIRNDGKSIVVNWISPACETCRTGVGSATFFISLQCHRQCFYCFNPNQDNYENFARDKRDVLSELKQIHAAGQKIKHLALTGGEPLLHKREAVAVFRYVGEHFPEAQTRLYTCGDHVDSAILAELKEAGLDEIRFSIRMHDLDQGHLRVFERIALAKEHIPSVMVEMPVLPGTFDAMTDILLQLDQIGIDGINLLEFCYPLFNADAFNAKGYAVKSRPYRVPYNYWYAGGLPIARSELECLDLLEFTIDRGLPIGVHYCSLENKHTGQIYQQNFGRAVPATAFFSTRDFFLKSAKVFGADIAKVVKVFKRIGYGGYTRNQAHDFVEFHVDHIPALKGLPIEIGLASSVLETREDSDVVRELKVDLTYPHAFDRATDV